jgi:hypothetical protein
VSDQVQADANPDGDRQRLAAEFERDPLEVASRSASSSPS